LSHEKNTQHSFESLSTELPVTECSSSVLCPRLDSKRLFTASNEVIIEHAGQEYRLRLTRQGKLILTK
jgi:hemin uptake protein HemP